MRGIKRTALLCAALLALCGAGLAEGDIATYVQPDGVQLCALEDVGYFPAPAGLQPMYSLMQTKNASASVYLFIMPNGRALLSLSCTAVQQPGTAQTLMDAWEAIAMNLTPKNGRVDTDVSRASMEPQYGFDALHISTVAEFDGERPLRLAMDGAAFYRGGDLVEIWKLSPSDDEYTADPNAANERKEDLTALEELAASLDFAQAGPKDDPAFMAGMVSYQDPQNRFSLSIPQTTVILTAASAADAVAREQAWYAATGKGGEKVFAEWMREVAENDATLLLMHDEGLVCQLFCEDSEAFRKATVKDYQRLGSAIAARLEERFGSGSLLNADSAMTISGLEHAWLSFWVRAEETDMLLNLFAATDDRGLLREIDLTTMVDATADFDTREKVMQLLLTSLQYQ